MLFVANVLWILALTATGTLVLCGAAGCLLPMPTKDNVALQRVENRRAVERHTDLPSAGRADVVPTSVIGARNVLRRAQTPIAAQRLRSR